MSEKKNSLLPAITNEEEKQRMKDDLEKEYFQ